VDDEVVERIGERRSVTFGGFILPRCRPCRATCLFGLVNAFFFSTISSRSVRKYYYRQLLQQALLAYINMQQDPSSQAYADEVARLRASESDSDAELLVRFDIFS
jgi:hypothetical protein